MRSNLQQGENGDRVKHESRSQRRPGAVHPFAVRYEKRTDMSREKKQRGEQDDEECGHQAASFGGSGMGIQ